MRMPTWVKTAAVVTAAAAAGAVATDPSSGWYRSLRKPRWQPPPAAFPAVWSPLYALIAFAGARALEHSSGAARASFARSYGVNLALNVGWTVLFFRAHRPALALAEIGALNLSNAALLSSAVRADRVAAAALAPYAVWTLFATTLNAAIVALNHD